MFVEIEVSVDLSLRLCDRSQFLNEGLNPCPPAVVVQSTNHWTARLCFDKAERGAGAFEEEGPSFNLTDLVASGQACSLHLSRGAAKVLGHLVQQVSTCWVLSSILGKERDPSEKVVLTGEA